MEIAGVLGDIQYGGGRSEGRYNGTLDSIHWFTHNRGNIES
jgi:hypothetical protein